MNPLFNESEVTELQKQVDQQVLQRGRLEAELARLRAEHEALLETPLSESLMAPAERWVPGLDSSFEAMLRRYCTLLHKF